MNLPIVDYPFEEALIYKSKFLSYRKDSMYVSLSFIGNGAMSVYVTEITPEGLYEENCGYAWATDPNLPGELAYAFPRRKSNIIFSSYYFHYRRQGDRLKSK